jgi:hypothetical protein
MTETKKAAFLQASAYTSVSNGTATATTLAPGERIPYDEDNAQHKYLRQQVEAGNPDVEHLSFVEVDLKAEADQAEEQKEMLAKAEKIAAEQRNEQAQAAQEQLDKQQDAEAERLESGAPSAIEGTDFPPQDEEAQRLAEQSGPGQRATTQEDVVEEQGSKSGRRRSSTSKGD